MEYIVKGYQPQRLFAFFEEICAIPHGSGNEAGIADYLVEFAKARGLEYHRDAVNNVFIKAPATPGLENRPAILLQGHTDMVCEKNNDTAHDFTRDGLKLFVEDGWLGAFRYGYGYQIWCTEQGGFAFNGMGHQFTLEAKEKNPSIWSECGCVKNMPLTLFISMPLFIISSMAGHPISMK